jgi:hypothetical protein
MQSELGHRDLREAVFLDLGFRTDTKSTRDLIRFHSKRILDSDCSPSLAVGLANVAIMEKLLPESRAFFLRYLEINPDGTDRTVVQKVIADIDQISRSSPASHRTLAGRARDLIRHVFRDRPAATPPAT